MQGGYWNGRRPRGRFRRFRWDRLVLLAVSAALIVFGLVNLIGYGADLASSRQTAAALREAYTAQEELPPAETAAPATTPVPSTPVPSTPAPAVEQAAAAPTDEPGHKLTPIPYPGNPGLKIGGRFRMLRTKNKDIVGYLSISGLMDETVVQRDEAYYMDHDALGRKNVNGAIFLDSGISLRTRPYSLILYGHNMKTGAMFGSLRNYENVSFYRKNPFISFDTLYEEGRYVVFAAGTVSTLRYGWHFLDFFALTSEDIQKRQAAVDALKAASVHTCAVDVQPGDQLLLLVTCTEKDDERRVVAARRIRNGEDEKRLQELVGRSRKR